eukprot:NODE_868_length_2026_cov_78.603783_g821_i0.p1 GENE.NODE_868_length_2026_cov_78.603783_g821_i0~~NODE_868_length_2026_cov_78.603783_g821_i0.p1  ORF type:complete len:603 (-),score=91.96 NODE_868_length_2026_cov_78.603783_g821_i0:217-1977(-)
MLDAVCCCALLLLCGLVEPRVYGWGQNADYQLGTGGNTNPEMTPVESTFFTNKAILYLSTGDGVSFAACNDRRLYTWGRNANGELGQGSTTAVTTPTAVTQFDGKTITALWSGFISAFVVADGLLYSCGSNGVWLGQGTSSTDHTTFLAVNGGHTITAVATRDTFTAAIRSDGVMYLWGTTSYGQTGPTLGTSLSEPTQMPELSAASTTLIAVGWYYNMAVVAGSLYCWGAGANDQLGTGCTSTSCPTPATPTELSGLTITMLEAGEKSSACLADGKIYTWGDGVQGRLGHGDTTNKAVPTEVTFFNGKTITMLRMYDHCGAAIGDGVLYMWGHGSGYNLGNSDASDQTSPITVTLTNIELGTLAAGTGRYVTMMYSNTYGSIAGDPHFHFFHGGSMTIDGKAYHNYSIFSDNNFLWNMQFVPRRHNTGDDGTEAGPCGFKTPNATVLAHPTKMAVRYNGIIYPLKRSHSGRFPLAANPRYYMRIFHGHVVLHLPCLIIDLQVARKKSIMPLTGETVDHSHFNFNLKPAPYSYDCHDPHGLFGQTLKFKTPRYSTGPNGEGVIDGVVADYEVPCLTCPQNKFNKFK